MIVMMKMPFVKTLRDRTNVNVNLVSEEKVLNAKVCLSLLSTYIVAGLIFFIVGFFGFIYLIVAGRG
jgi:hypothetical protein